MGPALAAFLVLAFAASMLGGLAPTVEGFLERVGLERILSFRSGLLVAVAATDVLPESLRLAPAPGAAAAAAALLLGWILHHDEGEHAGHELTHPHVRGGARGHRAAATAALFAHSLVDGVNLGATAFVGGPALLVVGAATALHKIADGFTLTSLFHRAGRPRGRTLALLLAVSLATPAGALLARAGTVRLGAPLAAALLGFAGGSFLYVGGALALLLLRRRRAESALSFGGGLAAMLLLRGLAP